MVDLNDVLADVDRPLVNQLTVDVLLSTDHAVACAQARRDLSAATDRLEAAKDAAGELLNDPAVQRAQTAADRALAAVKKADADAKPHLRTFVVQSVGTDLWEELIDLHPPTEQQRENLGDALDDFNPRTFPLIAVAVCLSCPAVPAGQVDAYLSAMRANPSVTPDPPPAIAKLRSKVPEAVWQQLWGAVYRVNRGANAVPKSLTGSANRRSSPSG